MRFLLSLIIFSFVLATGITNVAAKTTDWMSGYQILKLSRSGEFRGKIVNSIKCMDSKSKGLDVGKTIYKVSYGNTPADTAFYWAVGNTYGKFAWRAKKNNYELVSHDQFTRASGLVVRCGVWHKKN